MDRRLSRWRPLVSGLAGFGIATGLCILMHEGGSSRDAKKLQHYLFAVGLVWGLPAAVCSWLAGKEMVQEGPHH
jgi:hypothetical protein